MVPSLLAFHPNCGHRPDRFTQIELVRPRGNHRVRPHRAENSELKRERGNALLSTQLQHECWRCFVGQSGEMLDTFFLANPRKRLIQMPFPPGWVVAGAIPVHRSPRQDRFNPLGTRLAVCAS